MKSDINSLSTYIRSGGGMSISLRDCWDKPH